MTEQASVTESYLSEPKFLEEVKRKFQKDTLPVLRENERWRNRSRRADFETCLPGSCPGPGDWPKPDYSLAESD